METRPLSELYQFLHFYISENQQSIEVEGICSVITELSAKGYYTDAERKALRHNFAKNKPTILLHSEFYKSDYFNKKHNYNYVYWWKFCTFGQKERLTFLKYLIDNHIK